MFFFFITFLFLYGGLHFYFFLKIRALAPDSPWLGLVALGLCLGLFAPFLLRAAERYGLEALAAFLSWVGYLWMAVLFLFCVAALLTDLYRFSLWLAGAAFRVELLALAPSAWMRFCLPLVVALAATAYGSYEACRVRVERLQIHSAKIPREAGPIRIVQISDVHVGVLVKGARLTALLREVHRAEPDLLVSTGDLVDGQLDSMAEAAAQFAAIRPRLGKYAVTGNHEYYAGLDEALAFTKAAGFTLLRGEAATVAGVIELVGVDDPTIRALNASTPLATEQEAISRAAAGRFTILLKHQPHAKEDLLAGFDLQLSGHTHRGQIFPFSLATRLAFPYHSGSYQLPNGALLHVNRGTGTWGPPVRFLAPPEITVIELLASP